MGQFADREMDFKKRMDSEAYHFLREDKRLGNRKCPDWDWYKR